MKRKTILALAIIGLLVAVPAAGVIAGVIPIPTFLTVYTYAEKVPVSIDHGPVNDYWIISCSLAERKESFRLVLPANEEQQIDADTAVKTPNEMGLLIEPLMPYSTASTPKGTTLAYMARRGAFGIGEIYATPPYSDVDGATWLTKARYNIGLYKNGIKIDGKDNVLISFQDPTVVSLYDGRGNRMWVENLGILPRGLIGALIGDYVVIIDPQGGYHLWRYDNLEKAVDDWNFHMYWDLVDPIHTYTWDEIWTWLAENGKLPSDVGIGYATELNFIAPQSILQQIKVTYPQASFAGQITLYIPDTMAETIIILLHNSIPEFVGTPTITRTSEGGTATLTAIVKNIGTSEYITVVPTSLYGDFTPGSQTWWVPEGQTREFTFQARAKEVLESGQYPVDILAKGTGGSKSVTIYWQIDDVVEYGSIEVTTNPYDVSVYLDGVYQGKTQKEWLKSTGKLTIESVLPGSHTIKLVYGAEVWSTTVYVTAGVPSYVSHTFPPVTPTPTPTPTPNGAIYEGTYTNYTGYLPLILAIIFGFLAVPYYRRE